MPARCALPPAVDGFSSLAGFASGRLINFHPMARESDMMKRLMWSGVLAAAGALASIAANRVAVIVWRRLFHEDPPE
jgi:hypothetical protein